MLHCSEYQVMRGTVPSCEAGSYHGDKAKKHSVTEFYQSQGRAGFLTLVSCISINRKLFAEVGDS